MHFEKDQRYLPQQMAYDTLPTPESSNLKAGKSYLSRFMFMVCYVFLFLLFFLWTLVGFCFLYSFEMYHSLRFM